MIYYIFFLMIIAYAVFGAYIYVYRKEKVNMSEVMNLFWITLILKGFDILSTIFFVNRLGIEYEGNLIAKVFMYMFGIYGGIFVSMTFLIPLSFFTYVAVNSMVKGTGWKIFKIMTIIISITIPILNFISAI